MNYYIDTTRGPIRNDSAKIVCFGTYDSARQFVINHCDLSDPRLMIRSVVELWKSVGV